MEESAKAMVWRKFYELETPRIIVTVTQLPSGALETQVNNEQLITKMQYIMDNYDEDLHLIRNAEIHIVGVIVA